MSYQIELDRMLDEVIRIYGHESREAIKIATAIDKCYEDCSKEELETVIVTYNYLMKKS